MKRFLLFCSGANLDVLRRCPSEETKYVGIGATILMTAALASLSGGYALYTVFGSVLAAVPFGVLWGTVIFNLDRVIVSGMRKQRHRGLDVLFALPRLAVAVLLALVVSRPLELRLFDAEIRTEWAEVKAEAREQDRVKIGVDDERRVARLESEIERRNDETRQTVAAANEAREAFIREKEGTAGTGIPGAGSVFRERQAAYEALALQARETAARNDAWIHTATVEVDSLRADKAQYAASVEEVRDDGLGLLMRMRMLERLKHDPAVRLASLVITLLFLALETAPVVVKLLATLCPYRPYDELLEQHEFEIVEAVRQDIGVRRQVLRDDARRRIHESRASLHVEMDMDLRRHDMRRDAELQASEALMGHIADAQVQLAERVVDEWRQGELSRIERDPEAYLAER